MPMRRPRYDAETPRDSGKRRPARKKRGGLDSVDREMLEFIAGLKGSRPERRRGDSEECPPPRRKRGRPKTRRDDDPAESPAADSPAAAAIKLPVEPVAAGLPVWIPRGKEREKLRPEVQAFLERTVGPLYRQLASEPGSVGNFIVETLLRMSWLEMLQQLDISDDYQRYAAAMNMPANVDEDVEKCIRLGTAKARLVTCLLKLQKMQQEAGSGREVLPVASLPIGEEPRPVLAADRWGPDERLEPGELAKICKVLREVTSPAEGGPK